LYIFCEVIAFKFFMVILLFVLWGNVVAITFE
jgi:hypothetical protein